MLISVLQQLLTLLRDGKSMYLPIDQIIILYLLLHEIICLDDKNFLIGMCFGDVTYLLALPLSICTGVTFQ